MERELTSFDTSDDEPMVRPMSSHNVVPRVTSASFPGQSRHLRRLAASSRSITLTSSTVPAASGELQLLERGRRGDAVPVMDTPAEGEMFGGEESEADSESLSGAASEVEIVEVPEPTVDSDPIPTEPRLRAAPARHVVGASWRIVCRQASSGRSTAAPHETSPL